MYRPTLYAGWRAFGMTYCNLKAMTEQPKTGYTHGVNYYAEVNEDVRAALLAALKEKGVSQAELARRMGIPRQNISRAITGSDPQGKIPPIWMRMLKEAGLKIVAVKDEPESGDNDD